MFVWLEGKAEIEAISSILYYQRLIRPNHGSKRAGKSKYLPPVIS